MPAPYNLELFKDQAADIKKHLPAFPGCIVAQETDRRIIVRCPTQGIARQLAFAINDLDYCVAIKPGRRSSLFYLRVFLNQFI